ncbi:MAG: hypothetical protein JXB05_12275 [Myxococcaceae bacterium]|nr:hypothetical protein [Myxococcaceae bacterium]
MDHRERRPAFFSLPPEDRELLVDVGLCTEAGTWLADRRFFDWIRRRAAVLESPSRATPCTRFESSVSFARESVAGTSTRTRWAPSLQAREQSAEV